MYNPTSKFQVCVKQLLIMKLMTKDGSDDGCFTLFCFESRVLVVFLLLKFQRHDLI